MDRKGTDGMSQSVSRSKSSFSASTSSLNLIKQNMRAVEIRIIGVLITWIILADSSLNIDEIPDLVEYVGHVVATYGQQSPSNQMAAMQITAAIALTRNVYIVDNAYEIVENLVKNNYCFRAFDCDLLIHFLMQIIQNGGCESNGEVMTFVFSLFVC